MADYAELVRRLRSCAAHQCECEEDIKEGCWDGMMYEAADAIEQLQKSTCPYYIRNVHDSGDDSLCDKYKCEANALPRWIPVTEKPPLKVGDDGYNGYLVYANDYYAVADYTVDKFDDVQYFYVDGEYEPDVTHYMTLPKPPREEAE